MAILMDHFGQPHTDAATTCLLVLTLRVMNICVLTVGAVCSVGILAEQPAGVRGCMP